MERIPTITQGCDFTFRISARRIGYKNFVKVSFEEITNIVANLISLPSKKTPVSSSIDDAGRLIIPIDGQTLDCNMYGLELIGFYNNGNWRHQIAPAVEIVKSSAQDNYALVESDDLTIDIEITLGETTVSSRVLNTVMEEHNTSKASHQDIRQEISDLAEDQLAMADRLDTAEQAITTQGQAIEQLIEDVQEAGNVDDVLLDGESILGQDKIARIDSSGFGHVDDVKVNGQSVLDPATKSADIPVPTKVSELVNDSGFATQQEAEDMADEAKITEAEVAVDDQVGTPSATASVVGHKLILAFQNILGDGIESVEQTTTSQESGGTNIITVTTKGGKVATFQVKNGEKGDTVILDPENLQTYTLYNGTGENTDGAMTQAAATREFDKIGIKLNGLDYLNPISTTKERFINKTSGSLNYNILYEVTDFIDVSENTGITYSSLLGESVSAIASAAFYNSDKELISAEAAEQSLEKGYVLNTIPVPENAKYARFTLYSDRSLGRFLVCDPQRDAQEKRAVEILSQTKKAEKLERLVSSNLIDQDNIVDGYLGMRGEDMVLANYVRTDGYIEILPATDYKIMSKQIDSVIFRRCSFYKKDKSFIKNMDSISAFQSPDNAAYIRVAFLKSYGNDIGLVKSDITEYEDFYDVLAVDEKGKFESLPENSLVSKKHIIPLGERITVLENKDIDESTITLVKEGESLRFIKENNYIEAKTNKNPGDVYAGNPVFNFVGWQYNGGANSKAADNVAPLHVCGTTIGANHGWYVRKCTISAHGLGNSDVGGLFEQNEKKFYLLRVVDNNSILLISENIGTKANPARNSLDNGAIIYEDRSLVISANSGVQLYPSVNNVSHTILKNGISEINENGEYVCKYVDIQEEYDIMDVDSIVSKLIAAKGNTNPPVFNGDALVHVRNTYRIMCNESNMTVLVIASVLPKDQISLQDMMFAQDAGLLSPNSNFWYIPNSKAATLNFVSPVMWDVNSSVFINEDYWADENNPVNRIITFDSNVCFSIGFIKTFGVGKELKSSTQNSFELRGQGAGKIYPHGVESSKIGESIEQKDIYTGVLYKCFSNSLNDNRISFYHFPLGDKEYIYVDYRSSCIDQIKIGKKFEGKPVEIIESRNTMIKSDIYNNGVDVVANYVEGESCFAVIAVKI